MTTTTTTSGTTTTGEVGGTARKMAPRGRGGSALSARPATIDGKTSEKRERERGREKGLRVGEREGELRSELFFNMGREEFIFE